MTRPATRAPRTIVDVFGSHVRAGQIPAGLPLHFHSATADETSDPMDVSTARDVAAGLREYGLRAAYLPCWGVCR